MSNIIDKIQVSGVTYDLVGGSGGNPTIELTQAQYDALVTAGTVQADTYYIITDAQAGDLTNYYTKTETNTLLNGKQATLVSGTNIKTINNTSILGSGNIDIQGGGGGGKAVSGGTNISITTGETADTINCTVPISADTNHSMGVITNHANNTAGHMSFAGGYLTKAKMDYSFAFGMGAETNYYYSTAIGQYTKTTCFGETAFGCYNESVSASTNFDGNSGNTLFSVGNGTASNARHNAFEIRQNGDIYITSGGTDIKLQDNLGGGGSSYTAGDGIDISNNVISVTGKVDATTYNTYTAATDTALASKQTTLTAGTGISIVDNVISATGGGGGGITSGEVQTMIDESISGKTNQNDNLFTIRTNVIETVFVSSGAKLRIIFAFDIIQNNQIVLSTDTVNDKSSLLSSLATLGFDNKIYDIRGVNYSEDTSLTSYFGEFLGHKCYAVLLGYVPDFGSITIGLKRNNVYYTLDSVGSGKYNYNYLSNKPAITTSITSSSTDVQVPSAKAVNDKLGGLTVVKLTESEYTALVTKDSNTLYVVVPDPSN